MAAAKADFDTQNALLLEELPRLYDSRVEYFQPSLQAFVSAQVTRSDSVSFLCLFVSFLNIHSFSHASCQLQCQWYHTGS